VLARSVPELRERLAALAEGRILDGVHVARVSRRDPARIAFLFTGQGAQYAGMARVLDASEPEFRAALDRCARVLDARLERPLRELLFTAPGEAASRRDRIHPAGVVRHRVRAGQPVALLGRAAGRLDGSLGR
jgi:acyl transferase domain-containing protein